MLKATSLSFSRVSTYTESLALDRLSLVIQKLMPRTLPNACQLSLLVMRMPGSVTPDAFLICVGWMGVSLDATVNVYVPTSIFGMTVKYFELLLSFSTL